MDRLRVAKGKAERHESIVDVVKEDNARALVPYWLGSTMEERATADGIEKPENKMPEENGAD